MWSRVLLRVGLAQPSADWPGTTVPQAGPVEWVVAALWPWMSGAQSQATVPGPGVGLPLVRFLRALVWL
jgi:hypothetical protein